MSFQLDSDIVLFGITSPVLNLHPFIPLHYHRLCQIVLHADTAPFFVNYRDTLRETVLNEIVQPLCRDIETDLRLHIHTKHLGQW